MINSEIRQQLNESPLIGTSVTNKDVAAHLDNLFGETGWSYTFTQLARTIICSLLIKTVQRHVIVPEEDHDKALLLATEMFGLRTKEAEPQVEKPKVEKKAKEKAEPAPAVEQKPEPVNVETDDDALADEIFGKAAAESAGTPEGYTPAKPAEGLVEELGQELSSPKSSNQPGMYTCEKCGKIVPLNYAKACIEKGEPLLHSKCR